MKSFLPLLLVLCVCLSYSQTPQTPQYSRYIFPGIPKITSLVSVKNNKAQKQVWFTERDSSKIGTLVFPRTCGSDSAFEYRCDGIHPFKITYAEKAITISDNAVRPAKATKHKPTVWFIDQSAFIVGYNTGFIGTDSIYGFEPPGKNSTTGYLAAYPTYKSGIGTGAPMNLTWAPAVSNVKATLWFSGIGPLEYPLLLSDIYSLEPTAKGAAPYEANLTQFSSGAVHSFTNALHVENGFVWSLREDTATYALTLVMMPAAGGQGFSINLGIPPSLILSMTMPVTSAQIQPLYSSIKPKANILPNQIWVTTVWSRYIINLNPSLSPTAIDTVCTINDTLTGSWGLFSDNVSKIIPGKWMHGISFGMSMGLGGTANPASSIQFMQAAPRTPVQRTSVQFAKSSIVVNGSARPIARSTKMLTYTCGAPGVTNGALKGCLTRESDLTPCEGSIFDIQSMDFSTVNCLSIVGMSDGKKFDLVANQPGGQPFSGSYSGSDEAAILRVTGTYSRTGSMAGENDPSTPEFMFDEENAAQTSEYALDDAYPNPFNPVTNIQFSLPVQSVVTLKVYNMLGQEVASLLNGVTMSAGTQTLPFDASALPSGVYFYRLQAQSALSSGKGPARAFTSMKKVVLVK